MHLVYPKQNKGADVVGQPEGVVAIARPPGPCRPP